MRKWCRGRKTALSNAGCRRSSGVLSRLSERGEAGTRNDAGIIKLCFPRSVIFYFFSHDMVMLDCLLHLLIEIIMTVDYNSEMHKWSNLLTHVLCCNQIVAESLSEREIMSFISSGCCTEILGLATRSRYTPIKWCRSFFFLFDLLDICDEV